MKVNGKRFGIRTNGTVKKTVDGSASTRKDKMNNGYCRRCRTRRCVVRMYGDQEKPQGKKALKKTKQFRKRNFDQMKEAMNNDNY